MMTQVKIRMMSLKKLPMDMRKLIFPMMMQVKMRMVLRDLQSRNMIQNSFYPHFTSILVIVYMTKKCMRTFISILAEKRTFFEYADVNLEMEIPL